MRVVLSDLARIFHEKPAFPVGGGLPAINVAMVCNAGYRGQGRSYRGLGEIHVIFGLARAELVDARHYLDMQQPGLGNALAREVKQAALSIARFPLAF